MRRMKILVWVLVILLIGGFVSANDWITYDPDANVQWKLNSWLENKKQKLKKNFKKLKIY